MSEINLIGLEPGSLPAAPGERVVVRSGSAAAICAASQAISLKRIADSLDVIAVEFAGNNERLSLVNGIMEAIQNALRNR